jgi:hypothetical protein
MMTGFTACQTPRLKLHATTPTPQQRWPERGSSLEQGSRWHKLHGTEEENGVWLEMGSEKRSFSCRGEREMLGTRLDALPPWGNGKEEAHRRPACGGHVMLGGGWRECPMIVIPGAKQLQGAED